MDTLIWHCGESLCKVGQEDARDEDWEGGGRPQWVKASMESEFTPTGLFPASCNIEILEQGNFSNTKDGSTSCRNLQAKKANKIENYCKLWALFHHQLSLILTKIWDDIRTLGEEAGPFYTHNWKTVFISIKRLVVVWAGRENRAMSAADHSGHHWQLHPSL